MNSGSKRYVQAQRMPVILDKKLWFPDPRKAVQAGVLNGLVAMGGDLSLARMLLAYRSGIFPWSVDPITWWSPDPRGIFELDQFHQSRSLARIIRKGSFQVTIDQAFEKVVSGCAAEVKGRESTWISEEFRSLYMRLAKAGHAHSVECWAGELLAGGIFGVAIGGFFAGESMFHRVSNASKVALSHLVEHLRKRQFLLFDIQMVTPATEQMGAVTIPREEYLRRLQAALDQERTF